MKCWKWLTDHICKYVDINFLISKIGILLFSGIISIAPIFFVGLDILFGGKSQEAVEITLSIGSLWEYIKSSTDFVYALVGLSTIVLADVLGSEKKGSVSKQLLGLGHIIVVLFGSLIYANYKINKVDASDVKSLNGICFIIVLILSLLSYINLAIVEKRQEGKKDEH